jgi:predicted ATPase
MKLLGLEFLGVAGYKRQFVSFKDGINLITGRNNVGKSALLRSSTVLAHLPGAPSFRAFCERVGNNLARPLFHNAI